MKINKIEVDTISLRKTITKKTLKLISIDILFYFFIIFGFFIFSIIAHNFEISPLNISIAWTLTFFPILFLKIKKDIIPKGDN